MAVTGEGVRTHSYREAMMNESDGKACRWSPFEASMEYRAYLHSPIQDRGKAMEIELAPIHLKVARTWVPGKYLPQAPTTPRMVVSTSRVRVQTQYMHDHALIGNFLGFWPSERDLDNSIDT